MGPNLLVVVAGELGVDLPGRLQTGRQVERARGEADRVPAGRLPEQARPALGAEAAAGVGHALPAVDPLQGAVLDDPHLVTRRGARGPHVARPAAALAAVAHHDVAQRAVDLEADGAAEAAAGGGQRTAPDGQRPAAV